MDYKRVKSSREKGLVWLALILTAVILVQCVMNIVLIVSNRQTRAMFDEALQGQLTMTGLQCASFPRRLRVHAISSSADMNKA